MISPKDVCVSIIIPCFNQQTLLCRALASCLQQSHNNLDIIVIDDGSEQEIHYPSELRKDKRVTIVRQNNQGVARARNRGIAAAIGSFIKFLDADDELLPDCVERQVRLLIHTPNHICFSGYQLVKGEQAIDGIPKFDHLLQALMIGNIAPLHAGLYPIEAVRKQGGFSYNAITKNALEDYDFHWKLALSGMQAVTLHQTGVIYHKLPNSRSADMAHHFDAYIRILTYYLSQLILQKKLTEPLKISALHGLAELSMQSDQYLLCHNLFSPLASQFALSKSSRRAQRLYLALQQRRDTAASEDAEAWWSLLAKLCSSPTNRTNLELTSPAYALRSDAVPFAVQQFDGPILAKALKAATGFNSVWLWGKGIWCRNWLHMLRTFDIPIAGILDSSAIEGDNYLGYPCVNPEQTMIKSNDGILICSRDSYEFLRTRSLELGWGEQIIDYLAGH
ncbi:glycosyltransferase family 2 protein [Aliidiomarina celeris]|uniref:glycosyltransferase family 2 protein n=1 Tax=Aliidiomarina celeris TaxID=2249428 RepID=UPI000DEB76F2|nr:glycosyltransferase family 2 protein [Aliidiomarina celeris]